MTLILDGVRLGVVSRFIWLSLVNLWVFGVFEVAAGALLGLLNRQGDVGYVGCAEFFFPEHKVWSLCLWRVIQIFKGWVACEAIEKECAILSFVLEGGLEVRGGS